MSQYMSTREFYATYVRPDPVIKRRFFVLLAVVGVGAALITAEILWFVL